MDGQLVPPVLHWIQDPGLDQGDSGVVGKKWMDLRSVLLLN